MIRIIVTPTSGSHFKAEVDGREICRSRTPFLTTARKLLASGVDPGTRIVMVHASTGTESLRSTVAAAAALTVNEPDHGRPQWARWHPPTASRGRGGRQG